MVCQSYENQQILKSFRSVHGQALPHPYYCPPHTVLFLVSVAFCATRWHHCLALVNHPHMLRIELDQAAWERRKNSETWLETTIGEKGSK